MKRSIFIILFFIPLLAYTQTNTVPKIKFKKMVTSEAMITGTSLERTQLKEVIEEEYGVNGQLLVKSSFDSEGKLVTRVKYTYDKNGNNTLMETFDEKEILRNMTESIFNTEGLEIEMKYSSALGPEAIMELSFSTKYTYSKGLRTGQTDYKSDGSENGRISFTYDDKGHIIEEKLITTDQPKGVKTTYKYDKNGNCTEIMSYDDKNKSVLSRTASYDEKSHPIEAVNYNNDGTELFRTKYTYLFDKAEKMTQEGMEIIMPGLGSMFNYTDNEYNDYGQIVKIIRSNGVDGPLELTEIEYNYWD